MKRNQVVKIFIVLLVMFNLVQWWPSDSKENQVEAWQEIQISQLNINGVSVNNVRHKNTRNLFYVDDVATKIKPDITIAPINEYSNNGLPDIRLVGVLFKNKHYEAFLIKGEDRFKVRVNKYMTPRYKVKHINIKSIKLQDMQTGKTYKILLSDE
jgi:Tfp pilus assembly protein PilP